MPPIDKFMKLPGDKDIVKDKSRIEQKLALIEQAEKLYGGRSQNKNRS